MVRVYMTGHALPVVIKSAHQGDSMVTEGTDVLKASSQHDGVFLFRWSAVDYVETEEDE